ncbi:hypothetical protein KC19_3G191800 [Ceratodon purpureus]|uniref:Uncharacterized protein n=1 Tax=Ceratodon purpureus TaxID=3225 RepID=A0A8T0INN6_CERPU|nr:hypothetical protein KC19_3G191800 [Ceratodon purpureus]
MLCICKIYRESNSDPNTQRSALTNILKCECWDTLNQKLGAGTGRSTTLGVLGVALLESIIQHMDTRRNNSKNMRYARRRFTSRRTVRLNPKPHTTVAIASNPWRMSQNILGSSSTCPSRHVQFKSNKVFVEEQQMSHTSQ